MILEKPVSAPGTFSGWAATCCGAEAERLMPVHMSLLCAQALKEGTREYGESWRRRAELMDPPASTAQTQGADSTENMSAQ